MTTTSEDFERCIHCKKRVSFVRWALGSQWLHWPTDYGNYRASELYEHCRMSFVATPPAEALTKEPPTGIYSNE